MAGGGLFDPLGTERPARALRARPSLWLIALLIVLVGGAGLFATAAFRNGGDGGEPRVVAKIGATHRIDPVPLPVTDGTSQASLVPSGAMATSDQDVEVENGVRVIRPRRNGAPAASLAMKVPDPASVSAKASPVDDGLVEPGPSGLLPKVGADGRRPAEVYAGAVVPGSTGKPLISIVAGSLGNDSADFTKTVADWPAGVTLGFAVDGPDLAPQVASARAAGHEVVLMLPPLPGGTPGAVVTSPRGVGASSAHDRLRWQLSRFTGYAGVVMSSTNLDAATAAADLQEMTRRGLYVVDIPPARRPAAPSARIAGSPMATVDVTLTETAGSETPARFLERLASLARSDGSAIGIAPATPRSLAAISRFAATLADTGLVLVPLSAVINLRQSAQARPIPVAAP